MIVSVGGRRVDVHKALRRLWHSGRQLMSPPRGPRRVLVIAGFQRSGTTMLSGLFERDWRCRSYGEYRREYRNGERRMPPTAVVQAEIGQGKEWLSVLKPLVDSHLMPSMLDAWSGAKGIWIYRHFRGVVRSNQAKFGSENASKLFDNLISENSTHWVTGGESPETRAELRRLAQCALSNFDKLALTWLARNRLYYDLKLCGRADVTLLKYEDFVQDPAPYITWIYNFVGLEPPAVEIHSTVHGQSSGKGADVELSEPVREVCMALENCLDSHRLRL